MHRILFWEKPDANEKSRRVKMRLFVLNTDYVWRYKYKNDKHLKPNDRVWNVHHNQKFWADQFNTFWPYFYRRVTHSIRLNQKWPCSLVDGCPPISGNFWWKWPSICPPYCIHWHFCHGRHGQARYCGGQGHEFFIENFVKIAQKFQK